MAANFKPRLANRERFLKKSNSFSYIFQLLRSRKQDKAFYLIFSVQQLCVDTQLLQRIKPARINNQFGFFANFQSRMSQLLNWARMIGIQKTVGKGARIKI